MNPGIFCIGTDDPKAGHQNGTKLGQFPQQSGTKARHFSGGYVTPSEAATFLGVSKKTIIRWCESGRLPALPKQYGDRFT
jgi:hypothetical protein